MFFTGGEMKADYGGDAVQNAIQRQDKAPGWFDQAEQLGAMLDEGHGVAAEIVGSLVVAEEAKEEAKAADCEARRLTLSLARAIDSAAQLLKQLRKIREQF